LWDAVPQRLGLFGEVYGRHDFSTNLNDSPLEIDVGVKLHLFYAFALTAGAGNGLLAGLGSPQPRVYLGAVYAPDVRDRDHDGVPDSVDKCPDVPEDRDGFQDHDGCPDLDNDNDTIPDAQDKCPNEAEDFDGFQDEDGCPDPDNDKDGVLDGDDKCPNDPEDGKPPKPHDGCPWDKADSDGDGIPDSKDKCPNEPEDKDGFQDDDGCPDPDNDGDGIPDQFDQCPNEAEDMDGFEDDDGCPDPDNDHDGIPDKDDKCPNQPETINGYKDEDGCPDEGPPSKVKLERGQIIILEKVFFATDKAKILPRSFNLLNQVALTVKAHPELRKVEVQGHTDAQGSMDHNILLSKERAESVRLYLIKQLIDPARLVAGGYGPTQPIADNKTKAGREANRRVEFHILEDAGAKKKPAAPTPSEDKPGTSE
jgi:outer membrane protein OmpA-like peptidoglycan-associated protein